MRFVPMTAVALAIAAVLPAQPQLLVPLEPPAPPAACPLPQAAAREPSPAERAARQFRQLQVRGSQLTRAVTTVTRSLAWHDKLDAAARVAAAEGKPILWIQALGTLQGYT
jgi:hypothetical protein